MSRNSAIPRTFSTVSVRNVENQAGRVIARAAFGVLTGFLTSRAEIFNSCAPFGISAVAAAKQRDSIFVLIGAMIGYLLPSDIKYPIRYVAAAAAVFLFKWVLSEFEELVSHPAFAPCLAGLGAAITGSAVVFGSNATPYDILIFLTETLLCGCMPVFFGRAFEYMDKPSGMWGLSQRELISVTITLCVLILALEKVQVAGISLGRVAAVVVILCAARYGKETGGAIMGIIAGMILSMSGGMMPGMLEGYGFGGLIAGLFMPAGRILGAISFLLADAVAGITVSRDISQALTCTYEIVTASVIFMLLPESLMCRFSGLFVPSHSSGEQQARESICKRLSEAADALDDISNMITQVRNKLNRTVDEDIACVYEEAAECTCKKCGMGMYCWGTVYNDTMNALDDLSDTLKKNGLITREDISKHLAARCRKLDEFIGSVNRAYARFSERKASEIKAEQLRQLISPGLSNAACLMRDIADDFAVGKRQVNGGGRVRAALAACGLSASSSKVFVDEHGRLSVEAEINGKNSKVSREHLLEALYSTCGRKFDGPRVVRDYDNETLQLCFTQKPKLSVKFGEAEIQKNGETLCGDACESFVDERGRAILLLSDGMGAGGNAAVDSNLTVGLMSRLIRCGFGFEEAAKITGTAMMVKSADESFSTLDIVSVDLYDGSAVFLKAGASPTYVRRCGRVERIETASLPIGILPDTRLEKASLHINSGDVVVVISDGAAFSDDNFIIEEIKKFDGDTRLFAKNLAEKAKALRNDGHDDDITIMAAKFV